MPFDMKKYLKEYAWKRSEASPWIDCECGCGVKIRSIGLNGRPSRFSKNHDKRANPKRGADHARWKGGEHRSGGGYVRVRLDEHEAAEHPTAYRHGSLRTWSIPRSHLVWNKHNPSDKVQKGDIIHHQNHVRDDDRIENFQKLDRIEHARLHGLKEI